MKEHSDYLKINKKLWNARTKVHVESAFYNNKKFIEGHNSLKDVEINMLGDIRGKSILHLQCHFGQDSISMSRMGADVTGVDFSNLAIETANELAIKTKSDAHFINCDVYDLPNKIDKKFDIVFTTYGTIGWLPDLDKWAKVIGHFLKPGGKLIFVEFHPVIWMFNDSFNEIKYNYFKSDAIVEFEESSYANNKAVINEQSVSWNHSISEVINNLIQYELDIIKFDEFDFSPYNCFVGTEEFEDGKFRIKHLGNKIPMLYSILATKKT